MVTFAAAFVVVVFVFAAVAVVVELATIGLSLLLRKLELRPFDLLDLPFGGLAAVMVVLSLGGSVEACRCIIMLSSSGEEVLLLLLLLDT